jgi:hypothetical protein
MQELKPKRPHTGHISLEDTCRPLDSRLSKMPDIDDILSVTAPCGDVNSIV